MSGVLLSVAFSVLIRIKPIVDAATGPAFLRAGLLALGLVTLLVAALHADRHRRLSNGCWRTRRWRTWG